MTCATCKHFLAQSDDRGLCRRNQPTVFLRPDDSTVSLFPPMLTTGLCGEHKENDNA